MRIKVVGLALPVVIGMVMAVAACGGAPATASAVVSATRSASGSPSDGSAASPAASSSASAVPAGYRRVGGATQGISVAVPAAWVAVNQTAANVARAPGKLGLVGWSASELVQALQTLQAWHGILIYDVKYALANPQKFVPNLNAYCHASGIPEAGIVIPLSVLTPEYEKLGATHMSEKDLTIGGVPGAEISYQLNTTKVGTIHAAQLVVLPKPGDACFVGVDVGEGVSAGDILSTAAATAQFP